MAVEAKIELKALGGLPELERRQYNQIIDFLSDFTEAPIHRRPRLIDYIDESLYDAITSGLKEFREGEDHGDTLVVYLSKDTKKYNYIFEIHKNTSCLSAVKKDLQLLLKTTSLLKNLRGKATRRGGYCYRLVVDCSDAQYPSKGIHRLARLICAYNVSSEKL